MDVDAYLTGESSLFRVQGDGRKQVSVSCLCTLKLSLSVDLPLIVLFWKEGFGRKGLHEYRGTYDTLPMSTSLAPVCKYKWTTKIALRNTNSFIEKKKKTKTSNNPRMVTRRRENSREGHLRALCKVVASMKQEQVYPK